MGRLIYVREVSHWSFHIQSQAHKLVQDRETEPRFQSGQPGRGGYDGPYSGHGGRGGYAGGYGGGMGGGGMGGGPGAGMGGAGRQIYVSNVCVHFFSY